MIARVEQTGSTNADIAARIAGGDYLFEGYWLVADRQTGGRGRQGRIWSDGFGNFMGSTVVRPVAGDPPVATLALLSGLAVQGAIAQFIGQVAEPQLKWPNDVMIDGAKVAGILLEMITDVVVVGIGVNLASAPVVEGRTVGSLAQYGYRAGRDHFAEALALAFDTELQRWRTGGLAPVLRRWQSAAHPFGTPLTVLPPGECALQGTFAGLTGDGNLKLALADGSVRRIHAGDVLLGNA